MTDSSAATSLHDSPRAAAEQHMRGCGTHSASVLCPLRLRCPIPTLTIDLQPVPLLN